MQRKFFSIFLLTGFVFVILFVIYGFFNSQPDDTPAVVVTPNSYDFGEIGPRTVSREFVVRNEGESSLEIIGISTSCACTEASVGKKSLVPGEETTLTVVFKPDSMEPPVRGEVLRAIYIETDDPDQPETKVILKGKVTER